MILRTKLPNNPQIDFQPHITVIRCSWKHWSRYKTTEIQHFTPPEWLSILQHFVSPLWGAARFSPRQQESQRRSAGFRMLCRWGDWFTTWQSYLLFILQTSLKFWCLTFRNKCPKLPKLCSKCLVWFQPVDRPKMFELTPNGFRGFAKTVTNILTNVMIFFVPILTNVLRRYELKHFI